MTHRIEQSVVRRQWELIYFRYMEISRVCYFQHRDISHKSTSPHSNVTLFSKTVELLFTMEANKKVLFQAYDDGSFSLNSSDMNVEQIAKLYECVVQTFDIDRQLQSITSSLCGQYCIVLCLRLMLICVALLIISLLPLVLMMFVCENET